MGPGQCAGPEQMCPGTTGAPICETNWPTIEKLDQLQQPWEEKQAAHKSLPSLTPAQPCRCEARASRGLHSIRDDLVNPEEGWERAWYWWMSCQTSLRTWRKKNHPSVSLLGLFYWGKPSRRDILSTLWLFRASEIIQPSSRASQLLSKSISLADLQVCNLYGQWVTCCSP